MLFHSGIEGNIIVLGPSSERVEQEDWVLVAELQELFPSVFQEKDVTIVKWVSDLEGVDGISILGLDLVMDLLWSHSVDVKSIVELDVLDESFAIVLYQ